MYTKGFTLIETLVAIAILLLALVGPLTIAARSVSHTALARDQIVASYLASDAIEAILARKHHNIEERDDWDEELTCPPNNVCRIDTTESDIEKVELDNCVLNNSNPTTTCYLYLDGAEYSHDSSGELTKFQRFVEVEELNNGGTDNEKRVTVTVRYRVGLLQRDVALNIYIYNSSR